MSSEVGARLGETCQRLGTQDAIAFKGSWRSWRWLDDCRVSLERIMTRAGLSATAGIALVARNQPPHVAVMASLLASQRTTSMVYSMQSPAGIAADIVRLGAPVVAAAELDWTAELRAACDSIGALRLMLSDQAHDPIVDMGPAQPTFAAARSDTPEIAIELLSSGTTGNPKRIPLTWSAVDQLVADAQTAYAGTGARDAPMLLIHPLGNIAGLAYLAPALAYGQRVVLLEKFELHAWVDAVRTYRPTRSSVPPAGLRMALNERIAKTDLQSLTVIAVGGSKLDIQTHEEFERMYEIPVLTAYGATEFGGVIANWTLPLYQQYGPQKRGSVGRASRGVDLRIVDTEHFAPLPASAVGLLEVHVPRVSDGWLRTTDLGCIDADGFLFLHGRADCAINRGGFKIVPEIVADALRSHPAVEDAAVVGIADPRLGEVPVAAVELKPGVDAPAEEGLREYARSKLYAYQVPVRVRIVNRLPRNASLKVSEPAVRALFKEI